MSSKKRNKNKTSHSQNSSSKAASPEKKELAEMPQPFEGENGKAEKISAPSEISPEITEYIAKHGFSLALFSSGDSDAKRKNDEILKNLSSEDIKGDGADIKSGAFKEALRKIVMGILLIIIIVFSLNIVRETLSKSKADKYYSELSEQFHSGEILYSSPGYLLKDTLPIAEEKLYSDEGDVYKGPELEVVDMHTKYERMLPNLEALKQINSAAFAWIKVQGTRVDYPVVQSPAGDNDYYLSHGLDRTYSVSGAVFTDYNNKRDLSKNRNTCVYGHNMNDGTMFQTIMNFRTKNQFLNGQIEIYTADGIYLYEPFAVYDAIPTERFFHTEFSSDEDFEDFLSEIKSKSIFKSDVKLSKKDKIVTLITCTNGVVDKRFVVHGVLTEVVK